MKMSPELDLLDQLLAGDMALPLGMSLFGSRERAVAVHIILINLGYIELQDKRNCSDKTLPVWNALQVLKTLPGLSKIGDNYHLRITDKGKKQW
jgi:hypothetical protein